MSLAPFTLEVPEAPLRLPRLLKTEAVLTSTLGAVITAVDARDPRNAAHSERVTALALRLGRRVGLTPGEMETLELAALLHDVGKIAVPEGILMKPGELEESEWALIRQHPVRSEEILRRVHSLHEVARVVRHHHERVDGGGYPDRLHGPEIPFLARLIAVVDAYEAMTADRCYRASLGEGEARRRLREGLGRQFDRALGEAFLGMTGC
jgi:putative nucleotidyltransferase with HDIG domain